MVGMRKGWVIGLALLAGAIGECVAQPLPTPSERMKAETAAAVPMIVEDEATTAKDRIRNEATTLLNNHDYHGLDALAARLRRSTQTFAQGDSPIAYFYFEVADLPETSAPAEWKARMQMLRDWFENDPDSLTARVGMAYGLSRYAWQARGGGWASEVSQEGWQLFAERLTEARRILIAAESFATRCPVFYSIRLRVAQVDGTPREQYEQFFEEAVSAFPTYANFYKNRAYYLLPRWFGAPGEWEAFAAASADRIGGGAGDILYAQIIWSMHDGRIFGNIFKEADLKWPRVQKGFKALCRRYPNSIAAPSEYCSISGFAPDGARQTMRGLFLRLGNRVDLSVWRTKERWAQDRSWAFSSN